MRSFASERLVQTLGYARSPTSTYVAGIGEREERTNGLVTIRISSLYQRSKKFSVAALVMPSLTSTYDTEELQEYKSWGLADPNYFVGGAIDLIIGADFLNDVLFNSRKKGSMYAIKTHFG